MDPRITVRDLPSPKKWGVAQPGRSWHHVIPYSTLRDVWNRLVDLHINTQLPEARTAIRQYMALCDRNLPMLDSLIDRMRAENRDQRRAAHNFLRPLDIAEVLQLTTAAVWPAWNTVEGPSRRNDDPGDEFDNFSCGLTQEELSRMKAAQHLFQSMRIFLAGNLGTRGLRPLSDAIMTLRSALWSDDPIRYKESMWFKEPSGFWRKRRLTDGVLPAVQKQAG